MKTNTLRILALLALLCGLSGGVSAQEEVQSGITTKDLDTFAWRHIGPWTFSGRITDLPFPPARARSITWPRPAEGSGKQKTEASASCPYSTSTAT